jgi:hypothetical protein
MLTKLRQGLRIADLLILPVGGIWGFFYSKAWNEPLFWFVGLVAIAVGLSLYFIPSRFRVLKVIIFLPLPLISLIYVKIHANYYLLVDTCILAMVTDYMDWRVNRNKTETSK